MTGKGSHPKGQQGTTFAFCRNPFCYEPNPITVTGKMKDISLLRFLGSLSVELNWQRLLLRDRAILRSSENKLWVSCQDVSWPTRGGDDPVHPGGTQPSVHNGHKRCINDSTTNAERVTPLRFRGEIGEGSTGVFDWPIASTALSKWANEPFILCTSQLSFGQQRSESVPHSALYNLKLTLRQRAFCKGFVRGRSQRQ